MSYPCDKQTIQKIITILNKNPDAKRIVLQFPKQYLPQSFALTKQLRKISAQMQPKEQTQKREFYTLFDSMKKQCCTDIIGAQHISYHILIHFGEACFSEAIVPNHYYLFPTISQQLQQHFKNSFGSEKFVEDLKKNKIKYLLTEQKLYEYAKTYLSDTLKKAGVQLLKLPYDKAQTDHYLIFGYYANQSQTSELNNNQTSQLNNNKTSQLHNNQTSKPNNNQTSETNNNLLVLFGEQPQNDNKLISDIHLTMGSFSSNKSLFTATPQIFISSLQVPQIQKSNFNYAKPLMMRLALIGQLQKYDVFGLLVSNAGTYFSKRMVEKCKQILQKHNKRYFVFMMNNLNEVKLGNFPQIQVYVVISCFNNSCFTTKEFYRLVVTPMDLQVAFEEVSISEYNFDLNHPRNLSLTQKVQQQKEKGNNLNENEKDQVQQKQSGLSTKQQSALSVQQKQQMVLASTLQTLEYYRSKQYKGLDFSEKKLVQKIIKGKIGLAQQYQPLPKDNPPF